MQHRIASTRYPSRTHLTRGGAKKGEQFRRAVAQIFVRLPERLTFGSPTCPRIRHRLIWPRLILTPYGNTHCFRLPVRQRDQPLFSSVRGSTTVTTPAFRVRCAVPVGHHVRVR